MTLPSLKKLRTTPPSTGPASRRKQIVLAGLLAFGSMGLGASGLWGTARAEDRASQDVLENGSRLDPSSAEKRWEQLRAKYLRHHESRSLSTGSVSNATTQPEPVARPASDNALGAAQSITTNDDGSLSISAGPASAESRHPFISMTTVSDSEAEAASTVSAAVEHAHAENDQSTNPFATPVSATDQSVQSLFDHVNHRARVGLPAESQTPAFQMPVVNERPFAFSNPTATWTADESIEAASSMAPFDSSLPIDPFDDEQEMAVSPTFDRPTGFGATGFETVGVGESGADELSTGRAQIDLTPLEEPVLGQVPAVRGPDIQDRLKLKPLRSIVPSAKYAPSGEDVCTFACPTPADCNDTTLRCPKDVALPSNGSVDRYYAETMYHWAATNQVHNPLYFEDVRLERYGQHIPEPIQSLKSVGLFAAQFASLPYQMALDPVHECVSPLGFYRPGEAAPCLKRAVPFNGKAAATAAGVYTGIIFLVP